jgi:hypothetical protein
VTTEEMTLPELTCYAIQKLVAELGADETLRFLGQFSTGVSDYTATRQEYQEAFVLDDVIRDIKAVRKNKS